MVKDIYVNDFYINKHRAFINGKWSSWKYEISDKAGNLIVRKEGTYLNSVEGVIKFISKCNPNPDLIKLIPFSGNRNSGLGKGININSLRVYIQSAEPSEEELGRFLEGILKS